MSKLFVAVGIVLFGVIDASDVSIGGAILALVTIVGDVCSHRYLDLQSARRTLRYDRPSDFHP